MSKSINVLIAKLNDIIDEATNSQQYGLAKKISELQIEVIEERTKAWERGFDAGYAIGSRKKELGEICLKDILK